MRSSTAGRFSSLLSASSPIAAGAEPREHAVRPKYAEPVDLDLDQTGARRSNQPFRELEGEVFGSLHALHLATARSTIQGAAKGGFPKFELLPFEPGHRALRDFVSLAEGAMPGLALLDGDGVFRARSTGAIPPSDSGWEGFSARP